MRSLSNPADAPAAPLCAVVVDDNLVWLVRPPALAVAAAKASSAAGLRELRAEFQRQLASAAGLELPASLIDAAARVVAAYLEDLPDLPFVGEPFGGTEGTD